MAIVPISHREMQYLCIWAQAFVTDIVIEKTCKDKTQTLLKCLIKKECFLNIANGT